MPSASGQAVLPAAPSPAGSRWPDRIRELRRGGKHGGALKESRSPLLYTGSSILLSLAQMASGLILARWLGPRDLGLWQSVFLVLPYAYLVLGGINNGLSRELPYSLGKGDEAQAARLAGTSQFFTAAGSVAALLAGSIAFALLTVRHSVELCLSVAAVTLLVIVSFYRNYLIVTYRSRSSFVTLSWIQGAEGVMMLATLPLVYYLRYFGMLLRLVLLGVAVVLLMYRVRPFRVRTRPDRNSLRLLLTTGVPIFALDYFRSCMGTADRLALLHAGGIQQVGLYALAASVYSGFEVLPTSVAHYLYPRMTFRFGLDNKATALWGMCCRTVLALLAVMVPVAAAGWFCLPPLIAALFPQYVEGTRAAQLMLVAGIGAGLAVPANSLWSLRAWKSMVVFQAGSGILCAVLPFGGVLLFASPLTGVAAGMVAARFLSGVMGLLLAYLATRRDAGVPGHPGSARNDIAR